MPELELNEWLKPEDLNARQDTTLYFTDEGAFTEFKRDDGTTTPTFEIGIRNEDGTLEKKWTINKTSQRIVAREHGRDTKAWVSKPVAVFLADQNVNGKIKKVIYAREYPRERREP